MLELYMTVICDLFSPNLCCKSEKWDLSSESASKRFSKRSK